MTMQLTFLHLNTRRITTQFFGEAPVSVQLLSNELQQHV